MPIIFGVTILSFFLESIISNFIPLDSHFFVPLLSLMSLILIYPYFNGEKEDYIKVSALMGFLYDVVFTDTLLLNLVLFILIGLFICFLNRLFSTNFFSIVLVSVLVIIAYRFMNYGILCLSGLFEFQMIRFIDSILCSLLLNVIYVILLYFITDFLAKKYRIRKLD